MASQAQITAFVNEYAPYAETAAQATGLNAQLILAEWGNEVAYGTAWSEKNNIGNIGVYSGGPNPSYATIGEGVQAYINEIKSIPSIMATAGQSLAAQAEAIGNSPYASGHYLATGSNVPGSALIQDANVIASAGFGTASSVPPASLAVAGSASSSGAGGTAATAAAATPAATPTTNFNIPGYGTVAATGQQATALSTIEATLSAYGFNQSQVNTLTNWAWGEITQNVDPTQIAIDLQTPGTTGYQVFEQVYPGFVAANSSLNALGQPSLSVSQYQTYQTQAEQQAQAAGLPKGFVNSQNIGLFIGQGISSTELSNRINDAMALAYQSTPEQQQVFNQYFGTQDFNGYLGATQTGSGPLTAGQIASIALDPITAEPLIKQQIQAAQIGGAAVTSGTGAITQATASELAQAGITTSQATNAFQQTAVYAPLEAARPGMGGEAAQGVVSPDQLALGSLLGTPGAQRQLQTAEEVAKAPFSGGGGFIQNTKGTGVGSAGSSGAGQ